ncbi:MAG: hypothetical protein AAF235_03150, partial [Planctomycetota bacterium]
MRSMASVLVLCLLAAGHTDRHAAAQGGPPPANVMIDLARSETVQQQRSVTGEVRSLRRSMLASEVAGLILALPFDAGDAVDAGEVVCRLDPASAELDHRVALARVGSAEALETRWVAESAFAQREL